MPVNTLTELAALLNKVDLDAQVLAAIANDLATSASSGLSPGYVTTRLGDEVKNAQKVIADFEAGITLGVRPSIQDEGTEILANPADINFVGSNITVTDVAGVATITVVSDVLWFDDPLTLISDTTATYALNQPATVAAGDHIYTHDGHVYVVLDVLATGNIANSNATPVQLDLLASSAGGFSLIGMGAKNDGSTDIHTALSNAINAGGSVVFGEGDYYLSTQQVIATTGLLIRGAGKGKTKLILDCSGSAGLLFDEAVHCIVSDMTIQGNDLTAPLVQMGDGSGVTYANIFQNVRFMGNSGGGRPAITDTAHVAVRGVEATSGNANYFHRFNNCDFDSVFAAFDADFNANGWQVSNSKMQAVWRCFQGGFQQWMVNNTFWHSSAGSGTDYAIFANLYGKSLTVKSLYNQFTNTIAEPGATLTRYIELDANTASHLFDGDHQCAQHGNDAGSNTRVVRSTIGRYETGSTWAWRYSGDLTFGGTGNTGNVNFFGDGTTAYTGGQRKLIIQSGNAAETRQGNLFQQAGGDLTLETVVAGKLRLKGIAGGIALEGDGATNLTIKSMPTQTTVGAAGAASAIPASPDKYLIVTEEGGSTYAIPMFISL